MATRKTTAKPAAKRAAKRAESLAEDLVEAVEELVDVVEEPAATPAPAAAKAPVSKVTKDDPNRSVTGRPNDTPITAPAQHFTNSTFSSRAKARGANKRVDAADTAAKSG